MLVGLKEQSSWLLQRTDDSSLVAGCLPIVTHFHQRRGSSVCRRPLGIAFQKSGHCLACHIDRAVGWEMLK